MCNTCEDIQVCQLPSLFSAPSNPIGSNSGGDPVSAALTQNARPVSPLPALESWGKDTTPPVIQRKPIFVAVARAAAPAVMSGKTGLLKPSLVSSFRYNATVSLVSSALETRDVDCLGSKMDTFCRVDPPPSPALIQSYNKEFKEQIFSSLKLTGKWL